MARDFAADRRVEPSRPSRQWRRFRRARRRLAGRRRGSAGPGHRPSTTGLPPDRGHPRGRRDRAGPAPGCRPREAPADGRHERPHPSMPSSSSTACSRRRTHRAGADIVAHRALDLPRSWPRSNCHDGRRFGSHPPEPAQLARHRVPLRRDARPGKSAAYVRRCATVLARALDLARKRGLIDSNPAKDARPALGPYGEAVRAERRRGAGAPGPSQRRSTPSSPTRRRSSPAPGCDVASCWRFGGATSTLDAGEVHVAAAITDGGPGVGVCPQGDEAIRLARRAVDVGGRRGVQASGGAAHRRFRPLAGARRVRVPGLPMAVADAARRRSRTAGLRPGDRHRSRCFTFGTTPRPRCSMPASPIERSPTSWATARATLRLHYDGRTDVGKRKAIAALELY